MRKLFLILFLIMVLPFTIAPGGIHLTDELHLSGGSFRPDQIEGLVLWLDATTIAGLADGDPVGTWPDMSGQGYDATQTTTSKKPTYKLAILNGLPVVRFDGTDDFLSTPRPEGTTVFTVVKYSSGARVWHVAANDVSRLYRAGQVYSSGQWIGNAENNPELLSGQADDGAFHIHSIVGGINKYFIDGADTNATLGTNYGTSTASRMQIGCWAWGDDSFPDQYFGGDLAEMLIYNSALSDSDRQQVEQYLSMKWGIALQ